MAKKKVVNKKVKLRNLFSGKVFIDDNSEIQWRFFILSLLLAFIMITSNHWVDNKVVEISQHKEDLEVLKAKFALTHSNLMKLKMESELMKEVDKDSLVALEDHPFKIVIRR